jgi:hypothetical protein
MGGYVDYQEFIKSKQKLIPDSGFRVDRVNDKLFDYQKDIVKWAIRRGRAAIFTMTGTGKTAMQVEWAKRINEKTGENILIVAPLAVSKQTIREGLKFDCQISYAHNQSEVKPGLTITNYERLENFDAGFFGGIVLDESSILKSFSGKIRNQIIDMFRLTPYKLSCTATPSPNDFMELGNQAEFLNVMSRTEMLSMYFVHDGGDTSKWRLKGHAEEKFWEWMASWAAVMEKPSNLGYDDSRYLLPELIQKEVIVKTGKATEGFLFAIEAQTLQERQAARRTTISDRAEMAAAIVNDITVPVLVWCDLNSESEMLKKLIPGSKEIKGSDSQEYKEKTMIEFSDGELRVLITKPSICGFGMNWQHCHNMLFVGLSDSFEQYFQAVRRCWRYGQKYPVNVYIIISELEGNVLANIRRKEEASRKMLDSIITHTAKYVQQNIEHAGSISKHYQTIDTMIPPPFTVTMAGGKEMDVIEYYSREDIYECN